MNRIGEINYNKFGNKMEIIEYRSFKDIDIYFEEYNYVAKNKQYGHFKEGAIACPYDTTVYNVGFVGEGKYNLSENGKNTKCYKTWLQMIRRCYDSKSIEKRPTYKECQVCKKWHNYQNFAEWYYDNYYEIEGEQICLDKDILCKGNKVYSPETCVFVPKRINSLFIKSDSKRGDLPIGVHRYKNTYIAQMNIEGKMTHLGYFDTPHEAFLMYKLNKELALHIIANKYKDEIPNKLYNAMMTYEVNEND